MGSVVGREVTGVEHKSCSCGGGVEIQALAEVHSSSAYVCQAGEERDKQTESQRERETQRECMRQLWGVAKGSSVSWVAKFKAGKIQNASCQMGGREVTV